LLPENPAKLPKNKGVKTQREPQKSPFKEGPLGKTPLWEKQPQGQFPSPYLKKWKKFKKTPV